MVEASEPRLRHRLKAGLDSGLWTLDSGLWTLDSGLWTLFLNIYVWIYENEAKGLISSTKRDDIEIKRIVSLFFLPLPLYLAFTAVLSLFLARFHGLEVA